MARTKKRVGRPVKPRSKRQPKTILPTTGEIGTRRADNLNDNLDLAIGRIGGIHKRLSDLVSRLGHPIAENEPKETPAPFGSITRALEKTSLAHKIADDCHALLETVEGEI